MPVTIETLHANPLPAHLRYSGDRHPLEYGGVWYDVRGWTGERLDAEALQAEPDDEAPYGLCVVRLNRGSVDADREKVEKALECCGHSGDRNAEVEIEAVISYLGIQDEEPDIVGWFDVEDMDDKDVQRCRKYAERHRVEIVDSEDAAAERIKRTLAQWT